MMDEVSYQLGFEDGYRTAIKAVMDGSFMDGSFPLDADYKPAKEN
jgi:hypothetical protein